jgi:DNA replication and repair protein RecF
LILKKIEIVNYKNLQELSFVPHPAINAFVGLNGMGKTNILDAIHYVCLAKSNFSRIDRNNICFGRDFFRIKADFQINGDMKNYVAKYRINSLKIIEHNGKAIEKLSDHIGNLPLVIITPYDRNDLLESSMQRRNFINKALSQTNREYLNNLVEYNKLLNQRNAYLKSIISGNLDIILMETYNAKMYPLANAINRDRKEFADKINDDFMAAYSDISDGNEIPEIRYISQLNENDFLELTKQNIRKDVALKRSKVGIHKDDLAFSLNGNDLKSFGSQGQLKSFILSIHLSDYKFLKKEKKTQPLLILDDIFDKLDSRRLQKLINLLFDKQFGQVFISDTDLERIKNIFSGIGIEHRIFEIKNGNIINVYER